MKLFRTIAMPVGMLIGALLCRPIVAMDTATDGWITPMLIFVMLFITFCRIKPRRMHFSWLYAWLLTVQLAVCGVIYFALVCYSPLLAQGALICVLTPVAMASVVIGGMLGANVTLMATYSLINNFVIAFVAPAVLSWIGGEGITFWIVFARVGPMLILPFVAAQLCRWVLPRVAHWLSWHSEWSFYVWLVSLVVIIGRTTAFMIDLQGVSIWMELALAAVALVICLCQFPLGRHLGRRYDDPVAGAQLLGQKNTILAIWMSQSFLDPISSLAPTAYILWQNSVNSWQLYRSGKRKT